MKIDYWHCLFFVFCLACLAGCTFSGHEIKIEGKLADAGGFPVVYRHTVGGVWSAGKDTLALNADSTFSLTVFSDGGEKFTFWQEGGKSLGSAYLVPGMNRLELDCDADETLVISNDCPEENRAMGCFSGSKRMSWPCAPGGETLLAWRKTLRQSRFAAG